MAKLYKEWKGEQKPSENISELSWESDQNTAWWLNGDKANEEQVIDPESDPNKLGFIKVLKRYPNSYGKQIEETPENKDFFGGGDDSDAETRHGEAGTSGGWSFEIEERPRTISEYEKYMKDKKKRPSKEKEPKPERKIFNVGDILIVVKKEQKKLPNEAYEFLLTYNSFVVKEVNENGNLYLGFDRNGEHYLFSPNRFKLKPLVKKTIEKDPFDFDDED